MNDQDQRHKLRELSAKFIQLRERKRVLKQEVADLEAEMDLISQALVPVLQDLDAQNVKIEGVGTVYLATTFYVKANPENQEAFVTWLDDHGLGHLAKRVVHYQTLRSEYSRWMEENLPVPPPELVQAAPVTEVRVRKSQ